MTRISYSKRFLSLVLALALITACMVVSYAGSFDLFTGDDNTNKCEVKITSNGGKIEYVIGSVSRSTRNQYIGSPDLGADCILTAVDTATRQFMYWQDEYSGRVYSYDRVLSFKASSRMNIRAVFANVDDNQHFVSYVNYGDTVMLDAVMYANGATITPPTDTKLQGFTFNGWSKSSSEIQSDDSDMIVLHRGHHQRRIRFRRRHILQLPDGQRQGRGEGRRGQDLLLLEGRRRCDRQL